MQTVTVTRRIKAPIEQVFDLISDHANYKRFPGIKDSQLLRPGTAEKNGVGAQRRIDTGAAWFVEEITAFERPQRMDYRITRSRPPIRHQGGSVRLRATPEGTEVVWTSTARLDIPLLGGLLTRFLVPVLGRAFGGMLKEIDRRLTAA